MISINGTITIARPPEAVFSFLADLNNIPKWEGGVLESKVASSGPTALGTKFTEKVKMDFGTFDAACEVVSFEPPRLIGFTAVSKKLNYKGEYTMDAVPEGTKMTVSGQAGLSGMMKLMEGIMKGQLQKEVDRNLTKIKELVESTQ